MTKKIIVPGLALLFLAIAAAVYFWAQAVLGSEPVRTAIGRQVSRVLGQPVQIGSIRARIFPRVTIALGDVRIGDPPRIALISLDVGADLRALLSRRVEHATITVTGGRIDLPLPTFAFQHTAADTSARPAVEIVSVDRIVMEEITIASGGRTLGADAELVPNGTAIDVPRAVLAADGTSITLTGTISDPSGPAGNLSVEADRIDVLSILSFLGDFSKGVTTPATSPPGPAASEAPVTPTAAGPPTSLNITFHTRHARFATLTIDDVSGRAAVGDESVVLSPVQFGVLGGRYDGRLTLTLSDVPAFSMQASLADIDMTALTRFAASADAITGRLSGRLNVTSRGVAAADVLAHARGTGRVDVTNGIVKGLGLVRSVVIATSMRTGTSATNVKASDTPFSRLGATLAIDDGLARTDDLQFESTDVLMWGSGSVALDGGRVDLRTRVQLSDELSRQAGRDLVRYTASNGRVTLPATITGRLGDFHVFVNPVDVVKRAITNRAEEEAREAIKRGLDRILGR